jgi:hypothetical protein
MIALDKKISAGDTAAQKDLHNNGNLYRLYRMWQSGKLNADIDEITTEHGYGQTSSAHLEASRPDKYIPDDWTR